MATEAIQEMRNSAPSKAARDRLWRLWPARDTAARSETKTPSWRRKLTFTRLGRWYCSLTVGIGLAAINTGNNLLFLVLGLLLASIVVSGVLSENAVRDVRVTRVLPPSAAVGEPALIGLSVINGKPRAPSFSLSVREANGEVTGGSFILMLAPGAREELSYRFTPARRGRHLFAQLEVATRSPFGLFEKARPFDAPGELVVFPRAVPPPELPLRARGREGEEPLARAGLGFELHGLRDHRPGEDARAIHWRSSARAGRLLSIEREEERRRRVCIVCDARGITGLALETMLENAAALFQGALDEGAQVSLALPGETLPPATGAIARRSGLTMLALFEPAADLPAPEVGPGLEMIAVPMIAVQTIS